MKAKSPRKGSRKAVPVPEPQLPLMPQSGSWLKEICSAQISSVVAMAFVVFAAGSVMAMGQLAAPEIATYADAGIIHSAHAESRVLGVSTVAIDDTALEAADPSGYVTAKPVSFDSTIGRWDYNIYYSVTNVSSGATLTIGTYVVQSGITTSGTVETGAILKPSRTYHLSLWVADINGNKQNLAHFELKTPKASTSSKMPYLPCLQSQLPSASTTPPSSSGYCIKKDDGTTQCVPRICVLYQPDGTASSTPAGDGYDHRPMSNSTTTPPDHYPPTPPQYPK